MSTFVVEMTEEDNLKLKRAQYEKDTIADIISRNMDKGPNQFWLDKLTEATIFLEDCKEEMSSKYINPQVDREKLDKVTWRANFKERQFEVTVND